MCKKEYTGIIQIYVYTKYLLIIQSNSDFCKTGQKKKEGSVKIKSLDKKKIKRKIT